MSWFVIGWIGVAPLTHDANIYYEFSNWNSTKIQDQWVWLNYFTPVNSWICWGLFLSNFGFIFKLKFFDLFIHNVCFKFTMLDRVLTIKSVFSKIQFNSMNG